MMMWLSCLLAVTMLWFAVSVLQIAPCYAEEMRSFPGELQSLLKQHASVLHPDLRMVSSA